jgi:hypothetical protein
MVLWCSWLCELCRCLVLPSPPVVGLWLCNPSAFVGCMPYALCPFAFCGAGAVLCLVLVLRTATHSGPCSMFHAHAGRQSPGRDRCNWIDGEADDKAGSLHRKNKTGKRRTSAPARKTMKRHVRGPQQRVSSAVPVSRRMCFRPLGLILLPTARGYV